MVRCPWEYQVRVLIKVAKQEWKEGKSSDTERQGKSHRDVGCVCVSNDEGQIQKLQMRAS